MASPFRELQGVIGSETSDALTFVRSELQVLTSRALVQAVIEELNLTADPEFNSALNGPPLKARIGGAIRDRLPAAFAARLVAGGILPPAHARPPSPDVVMANVVGAVTNEIGIIIDGKTLLMGVNFSSEQADIASAVVNSLITRYMAGKVDERAVADRKANADLERRAEQVHAEIEQLEQQIRDTREKYNLVQTRDGSIGQQQLGDLSAALTQASSTRAQLEANYQRAGILVRTGGAGVDNTDALGSSIIGSLRNQEVTAERRVAQLQTTLGPGHPSRVSAEAELASARAAVITEAKRAMAGLGAQAAAARQHEANCAISLPRRRPPRSASAAVQSRLEQLEKDANARRRAVRVVDLKRVADRGEQWRAGAVRHPRGDQGDDAPVPLRARRPSLPRSWGLSPALRSVACSPLWGAGGNNETMPSRSTTATPAWQSWRCFPGPRVARTRLPHGW